MERSSMHLVFLSTLQCLFLSTIASQAPALYIFGDSVVDSGNNNHLREGIKANHPPYGIDFPHRVASGRFTNGYTIADFFDKWLGLPLTPPYYSTNESVRHQTIKGFNYASGSAEILPEREGTFARSLDLKKQVKLFEESIQRYVRLHFESKDELHKYLSKSIFLVIVGSDDYLDNYLQPKHYNSSKLRRTDKLAEVLTRELALRLKELYNIGARKFIVSEISELGCLPYVINVVKPKTRCATNVNNAVAIFNRKLGVQLHSLSSTLKGSTFVTAKFTGLWEEILKHPKNYGIASIFLHPCFFWYHAYIVLMNTNRCFVFGCTRYVFAP
ncbi:hypothetical protein RJ640_013336 [Escallonia rubra]|uniref:GDSL esterase/lipase n=1 Tax=Escallonia rubra TaxID=112253 RepID=A0AA88UJA7_9ASTE|nr:hypothetical protein RJ640_013336 [Escallonia rubra]